MMKVEPEKMRKDLDDPLDVVDADVFDAEEGPVKKKLCCGRNVWT